MTADTKNEQSNWRLAVVNRLGVESDRSIALDVGVSKDEIGALRRSLGIDPFQTRGFTPARKRVYDALRLEPRTVAQISLDAYGEESPERRNLCKQVLYWLVDNGYAHHVRHGEYARYPRKSRRVPEEQVEETTEAP